MPRKILHKFKNPRNRPKIPIDWNVVDEFLQAGCQGTEIASELGFHVDTLYARTLQEKRMTFSEYSSIKRAQGDGLIRHRQYKKALTGDNTMLIFLGKNRLKQRDNPADLNVSPEINHNFAELIKQISNAQASRMDENISDK